MVYYNKVKKDLRTYSPVNKRNKTEFPTNYPYQSAADVAHHVYSAVLASTHKNFAGFNGEIQHHAHPLKLLHGTGERMPKFSSDSFVQMLCVCESGDLMA